MNISKNGTCLSTVHGYNYSINNRKNGCNAETGQGMLFGREYESELTGNAKHSSSAQGVTVSSYTDKNGRVHRTYTGQGTSVVESMKEYSVKSGKERKKARKPLRYSYQKISSQILMAKNSVSASKAVNAARRGLADLKRKLRTATCSDEEKQAALTHAESMLRIARKKKKNLEAEELIENTIKSDEKNNRISEGSDCPCNTYSFTCSEDDINEAEADSDEYDELYDSGMPVDDGSKVPYSAMNDETHDINDDMSEDTNAKISEELNEELNEELSEELNEELKEALADISEAINPHMDRPHFEKLKTKHRCEERKALIKADTEYLKVHFKNLATACTTNAYIAGASPMANDSSTGLIMSLEI